MYTRYASSKLVAGLIAALLLALPHVVRGEEPDQRTAPPPLQSEPSALQAAEAEARPLLPPPAAVEMPILVYHHVVAGRTGGSEIARTLFVTPEIFEQQLKFLRDNGYQSISFDDLADCLEYGAPLPERPVLISFDDGWDNQFNNAFPLLQKYGFTATFYAVTGYLDHQNFMTTDQLKTMMAAGMTIASHSRSHPALPTIGNTQRLKDEIAGSKAWLEQRLGVPITSFAYPYGAYSSTVVQMVKDAGYRTARTVDDGTHFTADNLRKLPALIYPVYVNHYRDKVELAGGETRR